jgi:hypothetical protein
VIYFLCSTSYSKSKRGEKFTSSQVSNCKNQKIYLLYKTQNGLVMLHQGCGHSTRDIPAQPIFPHRATRIPAPRSPYSRPYSHPTRPIFPPHATHIPAPRDPYSIPHDLYSRPTRPIFPPYTTCATGIPHPHDPYSPPARPVFPTHHPYVTQPIDASGHGSGISCSPSGASQRVRDIVVVFRGRVVRWRR